jgi:tetratricopeptide (TPR) repeat protein
MKPLVQVGQSYMALSEGDDKLRAALFEEAVGSYKQAMQVSRTIPEEEAFDYMGFDALCHAGLSCSLVKLGRYSEALDSAEIALRYFNRRGELNQEEGKQWIAVVVSHALALDELGRSKEALTEFRKAGEMIAERKGELPDKEKLQRLIEEHIVKLQEAATALPDKKPAGYKAWWEFWS